MKEYNTKSPLIVTVDGGNTLDFDIEEMKKK